MKLFHKVKMPSFEKAAKALMIARRIYPDSYSYVTNENGDWEVVVNNAYGSVDYDDWN